MTPDERSLFWAAWRERESLVPEERQFYHGPSELAPSVEGRCLWPLLTVCRDKLHILLLAGLVWLGSFYPEQVVGLSIKFIKAFMA